MLFSYVSTDGLKGTSCTNNYEKFNEYPNE